MLKRARNLLSAHRYKVGIFLLLIAASAVCVMLVAARNSYSGSHRYYWLIWNLILAWIPFALAAAAYALPWKKWFPYVVIPAFVFLWLIFFPNAPYLLTDFQHLNDQRTVNVPLWYDVILLVWFAWTGLLLGIVSLNLMQEIVRRRFGRGFGWAFVFVVAGLSGVGIYMGRFVRFNSWDIFQDPAGIAASLLDWLQEPSLRSIGFIGLYTLFFLFVYVTIYAFGHVLQESNNKGT